MPATAEQRHQIVVEVENGVSNLIHETLLKASGPGYWKTCAPTDVQEEVEKKIASELRKQPHLGDSRFSDPRSKLNFRNTTDYSKLIVAKANHWWAVRDSNLNSL